MAVLNPEGAKALSTFKPNIPRELIWLIDSTIEFDGGALFRKYLHTTMLKARDPFRSEQEGPRGYVGASILGNECARAVWYDFHWATHAWFSGRILRLFNRGHLEEPRFIAMLLMIGAKVFHEQGLRSEFASGHGAGTADGVATGVPTLLSMPYGLEFKTHSDDSFSELAGNDWRKYLADKCDFNGKGVRAAKFEHYVQMQIYMHGLELKACLYCAVNKNTDDLYMEIVEYNHNHAGDAIARAQAIIDAREPPPKLNASPGFWKCKFCDHNPVCHQESMPVISCRTCAFAIPVTDGQWQCAEHKRLLTDFVACGSYQKPTFYGDIPF